MNAMGSAGLTSIRSFPVTILDTSSKSSINCAWARALRSIVSSALLDWSSLSWPLRNILDQPSIAFSGVLSSWEIVARNSSFSLLDSSACRYKRSFSSAATSAWARAFFDASYNRALSIAIAACAASPTTVSSCRCVNISGSGCAKKSPPRTSPERETTGTAR